MTPEEPTFSVTLIKASEAGVPLVRRGEYMYTANWLPRVGETIPISRCDGRDGTVLGYVTRVDPGSAHPISVVEADSPTTSTDDLLA
jgi:hypothetical protein